MHTWFCTKEERRYDETALYGSYALLHPFCLQRYCLSE